MNPDTLAVFEGLEPASVWRHFASLCAIPRPSGGEARLAQRLLTWALSRGLAATADAAGNLILRKPASAGCESAPGVVLQAHLDMVCQANAGTRHDFTRDPITPVLRDGYLLAEHTTLGADNGIGVALILAALEDEALTHGPLEALLTVDEETGMGGAQRLATDALNGSLLLNLDTEEWGRFYLGCAGGIDIAVRRPGRPAALPDAHTALRIEISGLVGGHSGLNIHEGRGNAIKLLVRALRAIERDTPLRLAWLRGGSAKNALPREASAAILVPREAASATAALMTRLQATYREELSGIDEALALRCAACASGEITQLMDAGEQAAWLTSLHASPQGVRRMSLRSPGVVETSSNLGIVDLGPEQGECRFMARSLIDSAGEELAQEILSLFALSQSHAETQSPYPGWAPNPDSPLLSLCRQVFREHFGSEAATEVIHAGLECGLIGGKYPGMDMISFGPNIHGAHAPGERVEIRSVKTCWQLLRGVLAALAKR